MKKYLSAQDKPEIEPIVASGRMGFRFSLNVLWSHNKEDISTRLCPIAADNFTTFRLNTSQCALFSAFAGIICYNTV